MDQKIPNKNALEHLRSDIKREVLVPITLDLGLSGHITALKVLFTGLSPPQVKPTPQ